MQGDAVDAVDVREWIGRSESVRDTVGPTPVKALTATLDHPVQPVALAVRPADAPAVRDRAGRSRPARRLPATGGAAPADVGGRPVRVPIPGAGR